MASERPFKSLKPNLPVPPPYSGIRLTPPASSSSSIQSHTDDEPVRHVVLPPTTPFSPVVLSAEEKKQQFDEIIRRIGEIDTNYTAFVASMYSASASGLDSASAQSFGTQLPFQRFDSIQSIRDEDFAGMLPDSQPDSQSGVMGLPPLPPHRRQTSNSTVTSFESIMSRSSSLASFVDAQSTAGISALSPEIQADIKAASQEAAADDEAVPVPELISEIDRTLDAIIATLMPPVMTGYFATQRAADTAAQSIKPLFKQLLRLVMSALWRGLDFAITYPKLSAILMALACLQWPMLADLVGYLTSGIWFIIKLIFSQTTAYKKIADFTNCIIEVYKWCVSHGVNSYETFVRQMKEMIDLLNQGVNAIQELKDMADRLGVNIGELLQMVISLQQAFAAGPAPTSGSNGWQIFERIAGQFATGAGQGVAGALTNGAARGVGRALLQEGQGFGGSKKKRKTLRKQKKMRRKQKKSSKRK